MTTTNARMATAHTPSRAARVTLVGIGLAWLATLILFGSNGVAYGITLLGLPVAAGIAWGHRTIPAWWVGAALAIFGVVDWTIGDKARVGDMPFFIAVALAQFGVAAIARKLTATLRRRAQR